MTTLIGSSPTSILDRTAALGCTVPKPLIEAQDRVVKMRAALDAARLPMTAITEPFRAALEAGRNPATDPAVQKAYLARQIGHLPVMEEIRTEVDGQLTVAVREHTPALVAAWRKPFSAAADTLTAAREGLRNLDLDAIADYHVEQVALIDLRYFRVAA